MENNTKNECVLGVKGNTTLSNLREIADWQLDAKNAKVGLPALQRGYVWKPQQVETLWDSLLRGFPVGSFLVADNGTERKDLLDGQQRATAIAMGFYNPWDEGQKPDFFSSKFKDIEKSVPILWLDLGFKDNESGGVNNDFIFLPRLVTQSHPWGYRKDGVTIGLNKRRIAIERFDLIAEENNSKSNYTEYDLKYVYPLEANLPVPIVFLIEAVNEHKKNWKDNLIKKCETHLTHIKLWHYNNETIYIDKLNQLLNDNGISKKIEDSIRWLMSTRIPVIALEKEQLEEESNSIEDASTLFVRINTAGTPLRGEELIYSMYKTAFPESKEIVEQAGAGFIAPSRIINHISRIVSTDLALEKNTNQNFSIPQPLKLKQFQQSIKESGFNKNLRIFVDETKPKNVENLFKSVKKIFEGNNDFKFPLPLIVDIARANNPDTLFVLLYWLHKTELNTEDIIEDVQLHKKILATITLLTWFSIDTNKVLSEFAKDDSLRLGNKEFWNIANFNNLTVSKSIVNLPKPEYLKARLKGKFGSTWATIIKEDNERGIIIEFIAKLFDQRGLLLFVQRNYINGKFQQLQWDILLEDSNRPYDLDHIYPSIKNQHNTFGEIRELNNKIGNYRILALEDNRSDKDNLPKDKLRNDKVRQDSFIKDDWECWEKIGAERITTDNFKAGNVCNAIYTRIGNIYKEWYDTLSVGTLVEE